MDNLGDMVKLLEDIGYDCVSDPDKNAVFCFRAECWFYTIEEIEEWLNE